MVDYAGIRNLFAKASKLKVSTTDGNEQDYRTTEEWKYRQNEMNERRIRDGVLQFKRMAIGFFGQRTIKTLDELAQLLHRVGMVSTIQEGREIIPSFHNFEIVYGFFDRRLKFYELQNADGQVKKYKLVCDWNLPVSFTG